MEEAVERVENIDATDYMQLFCTYNILAVMLFQYQLSPALLKQSIRIQQIRTIFYDPRILT